MDIKNYVKKIREIGIETITGIPDSTLKIFGDYIENEGKETFFYHVVAANEGSAIGIAIGEYLATGKPACVYMQNSGVGNTVNPLTSLAHEDVYGIPMLLMIGWRGEPGMADEPQHKYMGKITLRMLEVLDISYSVITSATTEEELEQILKRARSEFLKDRQYALIIKRDTFEKIEEPVRENGFVLGREEAIGMIIEWLGKEDLIVSTTGKISRELYEQSDLQIGNHRQIFLTVGGMGHANMIACQLAKRLPERRVICLDGDGAILMHLGNLAIIGKQSPNNLIHICLNNGAHESVGGMPTGAPRLNLCGIAEKMGYQRVVRVYDREGLEKSLNTVSKEKMLTFLEISVSLGARKDLGRPKETAKENKRSFRKMVERIE